MEGEGSVIFLRRKPVLNYDAKAFIFDLDGTLLVLPVDWEGLRAELREVSKSEVEFKPIFQTLQDKFSREPELLQRLFETIDKYEVLAAEKTKLSEGSAEVLGLLAKNNKLSLVTMQGRRAYEELSRRFDLARFFSFSLTREDSLDRSRQLELALGRLNVSARDSVFVGDRLNDLRSAKSVGIHFVQIQGRMDKLEAEVSFPDIMSFLRALNVSKPT